MNTITQVDIGPVTVGRGAPLALIAGPCVIESEEHTLKLAELIRSIAAELKVPFVFKASYDKANRSSATGFRGPGLDEGLRILERVKSRVDVPVLSDIHEPAEAPAAGEVLDVIQIPAFLCRQTSLLVAAAETQKPVNIKKGQFMSPEEMFNAVGKVRGAGNDRVLLTERGTFFGYHRLVNDFAGIAEMMALEEDSPPVCFDATHSTQTPGTGEVTGGNREMAPRLARAAVALGVHAVFLECHPEPERAMSDAATQLPLDALPGVLGSLADIRRALGSESGG